MISSHKRRAAALIAAVTLAGPALANRDDAQPLLIRSATALKDGNASAAHRYAAAAVAADPALGLGHAMLACTALAEGDGIAAEAELDRARDAGVDPDRLHQLRAHARLLQGDAKGALAEGRATAPRYFTYGLRIQARALAAMGNPAAASDLFAQALARSPDDAATWADLGRFRRGIGDIAGATEAAAKAVALNRNATDALLLRGELVRGQFGLNAALPWFEAALKRDPDDYDTLLAYAATLGDAGRASDMLAAARRALAVRPNSAPALYLLAVMAARAGSTDLARDLMQKTGSALDDVPGPLLLGATLDIDARGYEQATVKLRHLVALQPMNIRARQLLAVALMRTGAARDALGVLRPMALRPDADSYTLTLVARAFEATGERDYAARFLDRAAHPALAEATPFGSDDSIPVLAAAAGGRPAGEPSTAIPLIRAQLDAGNKAGALARAEAVAAANPGSPAAAIVLGDTRMALGDAKGAASAYTRAAGVAFDEPTMLRLAEALEASGQSRAAADALALYLSQNPESIAGQRLVAHWQIAAGEFPAAIAALEGLRARLGDRDAALLAELAFAYDGDGQDSRARSYAVAAYALAPGNAAAADAYGWVLYGAGDLDGARQLFEKAVQLAPAHATLRWHLAQVYADLGRTANARTQANAALADPRFNERAAAAKLVG